MITITSLWILLLQPTGPGAITPVGYFNTEAECQRAGVEAKTVLFVNKWICLEVIQPKNGGL